MVIIQVTSRFLNGSLPVGDTQIMTPSPPSGGLFSEITDLFAQVLVIARELGLLTLGRISVESYQ